MKQPHIFEHTIKYSILFPQPINITETDDCVYWCDYYTGFYFGVYPENTTCKVSDLPTDGV